MAAGTKDDPWILHTPPGTSEYTMYRDDEADPAIVVCQVGSTKLTYQARAIDDLAAWLREQGDWVPLGSADEGKEPAPGRSRSSAVPRRTPSAAGTGCARATAVASACTCRRSSKSSGWPR